MNVLIDEDRKIFSILEEFNNAFPYLKLEIFPLPIKVSSQLLKKSIKHNNKTLNECRTIYKNGEITIQPNMTVIDLYKCFSEIYGLGVRVFRKSGKVWLETTVTDSWTLEEQNLQGEALSK